MKKRIRVLLLVLMCLFILLPFSLAGASPHYMEKYLPRLQGNWYDLDGNAVLTFDGASVNGCTVVDILRVAGGGGDVGFTVRIVEDAGYRDLKLSCTGLSANPEEYHQYIRLDHRLLRRFPEARFWESVGGLGLGMTKHDVISRYGNPDVLKNGERGKREFWKYETIGLGIEWENGIVVNLQIYKDGNRHFDSNGFNALNSPKEYADYYGWDRVPKAGSFGSYYIGYGEYLWFRYYPEMVELNLYPN